MATEPREHLLHWLRDAYAMEKQALEMLKLEAERIQDYPDLKERIEQHIEETKAQSGRLDRCFAIIGEEPSAVKGTIGWFVGSAQAACGIFASDEIIKDSMSSYVFENLEIASYTILIAAAELDNQHEIAMADWLKHHLAPTTQKFLQTERTEHPSRI